MCREEAIKLASNRELIAEKWGIRLVAVCHELFGADYFESDVFKGEVYVDESKSFFAALGGGEVKKAGIMSVFSWSLIKKIRAAKASGVEGNMKGDGFTLGGIMLVTPEKGIVFSHSESEPGDRAPIDEVLKACEKVAVKGN